MNNFCYNPTRYFIRRRKRIPIYFFVPPYAHFVLFTFYRIFRFFNRFSLFRAFLLYLYSPHICPFISTNIILLWYYIISFFYFHLISARLNVRLHFAFILFCVCIYIYIYTSTEIHRNPTKKQFHRYLLGIPLAKNMFFIPEDTYYKPWRAIIFLLPPSSNTILFILESSWTRDFHEYVRTKEKRISVEF